MPPRKSRSNTSATTALTLRDLNRATLARQCLLERTEQPMLTLVRMLVALQAQVPGPPYVGLWSRLAGFARGDLAQAIEKHTLVRATFVRGTLHLLDAEDFVRFRPLIQPVLSYGLASVLKDRLAAMDVDAVCTAARRFLTDGPRTFGEIRDHLVARFPGGDERAMGYTVRMTVPLVQVPGPGAWGFSNDPGFALADSWLGREVPTVGDDDLRPLVLRYLAAFGPADARDFQVWSGMRAIGPLRAAFESLRPELTTLVTDTGREVFDLPDAPRPGGDSPAPVRFLPEWDNLLQSHADRTRVVADADKPKVFLPALRQRATVLIDGFARAGWSLSREKKSAVLAVELFAPVKKAERAAIMAEGERLARFMDPDASGWKVVVE